MILSPLDPDRLYGAISARFATRTYDGRPLDGLDDFSDFVARTCIFDDVRAVVVPAVPEGFFTGIIGSYFKVEGAPSALALIVKENDPVMRRHAGYLGEALVLEATARGFSTCWIAGSFSRERALQTVDLAAGEHLVVVISLGYGTEPQRPAKRKDLEKIAPGHVSWPLWARRGLEAARLAPSAMNRQPWRFACDKGAVAITGAGFSPRRHALDCGIASLHFELGAFNSGVRGVWDDKDAATTVFRPVGAVETERAEKVRKGFPLRPSTALGARSEGQAQASSNDVD